MLQQHGTAAGGFGALTGPTAYQPFMSPYQQDVIDTSLTEFDRQAQMRQQQMQDASLGVPGAFGGGREGVQQAEYQAGSDRNRAMLQAGLLQQGFGQAQMGAQQAFQNQQAIAQGQLGLGQAQMGLGREQMNLSQFQRAGLGRRRWSSRTTWKFKTGTRTSKINGSTTSGTDRSL